MNETITRSRNKGRLNARKLGEFFSNNGQQLLPMVDLKSSSAKWPATN